MREKSPVLKNRIHSASSEDFKYMCIMYLFIFSVNEEEFISTTGLTLTYPINM